MTLKELIYVEKSLEKLGFEKLFVMSYSFELIRELKKINQDPLKTTFEVDSENVLILGEKK